MAKFKTELTTSRNADEMRSVEVEIDFTSNALASILYRQGETVVLACCTKEARLPGWFPRDSTKGWVHAEYSLLPGSTDSRFRRERRGAKGRTQEIERLVARSLRAAVNLEELGPIALNVDCDILNADGGTRCASITAAISHSGSVYDASLLLVFAYQRTCAQPRNNAAQDGALLFSLKRSKWRMRCASWNTMLQRFPLV